MRKQQIIILGVVLGLALLGLVFVQARYFQMAFKLKKTQFDYTVNKAIDEVVKCVESRDNLNKVQEGNGMMQHGEKTGENWTYIDMNQTAQDEDADLLSAGLCPISDEEEIQNTREFLPHRSGNLEHAIEKNRQEIKKKLGNEYDVVRHLPQERSRSIEERIKGLDLKKTIKERLANNGVNSEFEFAVKEKDRFILTSPNFLNRNTDYTYNKKIFFGQPQSQANLYLIFPDQVQSALSSVYLLLPSLVITLILVLCFIFCIVVIIRQKKLSVIKNDFINNMTHEFKTPIATISLASQMLKDGAVSNTPETVDRVAGIIRDESKRLTFLVEKVLQTALFTETRMKMKLKNVHLNEIVGQFVSKFNLRLEERGGQLFCNLNANRDEVYGDEVHITNVISNLLDNAIKYCEKIPEISVYTRNKDEEIIISVIDNGIGIAAKEQKLIFERFYRVSTGNLHNVKGFGLGLSYVKKIVEAHGGRIEVESAVGKGCRFDIILPLTSKKQKVKRTLFF